MILPVPRPAAAAGPVDGSVEVELVLAQSEQQARVVARAMRSGFLVDQLLIPETRHLGRTAWPELQPEIRELLAEARAGEPEILVSSAGTFLVAQIVAEMPSAILGRRGYALDAEEIWAVLAVGPTDPRILSLEIDVETEDLRAICRSKKQLLEADRRRTLEAVQRLPPAAPARAAILAYSEAISALSLGGDMAGAIELAQALGDRLASATNAGSRLPETLHYVLGVLELRRGEVENCLGHHHREMCLFPLSEAARHHVGDGALRAFEHFRRFLERDPLHLESRWLLHIAAMTIGRYPEGVPAALRIPPEAFASTLDPGRLWNVAAEAGLDRWDNAGGSVADDFDGDGAIDLVLSSRDPCSPLRLYRNRGDGTFDDLTEKAGLGDQLGGLNVTQADFDNDGRLDLYVMRGGWETAVRDSLLRNRVGPDGGLLFEDVTARSGLGGPGHRTHSAAWADVDGDGWLDLFVGHELSFSQLFRNRADGTFEEITDEAGMRFRSLTKGATWGDVDGNGRPDLYVSNFGERNLLFVQRDDGRFDEVAVERGVAEPTYSFPTWFWDYDNDGHQDLFVATLLQTVDDVAREYLGMPPLGEPLRMYRNRGDGSFEDVTEALGMARVIPTMGANFGDLDSDGFLDLYLGTGAPPYGMLIPNRLFLNRRGRELVDVTTATGTGHLQKGHGVAFADFDGDADQDLFVNLGGAFPGDKYPSALFENPGNDNDWLGLELIGTRSNRSALGARIRVVLEGEAEEMTRERVRWVTSGGSFGSSPLSQHVGLGRDALVERIEIEWPGALDPTDSASPPRRQVLHRPPTHRNLRVPEGGRGEPNRGRPGPG